MIDKQGRSNKQQAVFDVKERNMCVGLPVQVYDEK